jgi:FKBP-type peptidyl-prolyl cis-trans isomerase
MNEGETVTFLFPSHMGYGYHGDNDRIGTNVPLVCTVTLNDIKHLPEQKKNN